MRSRTLSGLCLALSLLCGTALAAPSPALSHEEPNPAKTVSPLNRAPLPHTRDHLHNTSPPVTQRSLSTLRATAACDAGQYATRSGHALVEAVRASSSDCIIELFFLTGGTAQQVFNEAQMRSVADALQTWSLNYAGDNRDGVLQLVLYLRAGYYVQYGAPAVVGSYGTVLQTAIRGALDTFFAHGNSRRVTEENGAILSEAVILIDSARENARYLGTVRWLLDSYTVSWDAYSSMHIALNNAFRMLYRGHSRADFKPAILADSSILQSLNGFIGRHWNKLGSTQSYLIVNATRELARFLQYEPLRPQIKPMLLSLAQRSSVTGTTAPVWMTVAEFTSFYDPGTCSYYGLCNWKATAEAAALPQRHACSATVVLRTQSTTAAERASTCASVLAQADYFHMRLQTKRQPVAGDLNEALEIVVFNSGRDYETYAGGLFSISTNNGGMYLEGDPSVPGNQARFIAYEAEWLAPRFEIWNLNHEYNHYLDGRFNMSGPYAASTTTPTVWWIEGVAEHIAYCYLDQRNDNAIAEAPKRTYTLNQLFDTDYTGDSNRVYRWSYLAVSFMLERHFAEIQTVLGYYRSGNWAAARQFLKSSIGSLYDQEFSTWLQALQSTGVSCNSGKPANLPPEASFTSTANGLTVNFRDTSTDPDGSIQRRLWTFHDGSQSAEANPSRTYHIPGQFYATLYVWDNAGQSSRVTHIVMVPYGPSSAVCPARIDAMVSGCVRTGFYGTTGSILYFHAYVDKPNTTLHVQTSGGTGNADLYLSSKDWPTPVSFELSSTSSGNNEKLTVQVARPGYYFFSLHARQPYAGVSLSVSY